MKKEEFPTFLNEQPTIVFGRTGRELLLIACGIILGYRVWGDVSHLLSGFVGNFLGILLAIIIGILFLVLALLKIGYRPLEEWVFAWFLFIATPRVYLYRPEEVDVGYQVEPENNGRQQSEQASDSDDDFDEI